MAIWFLSIGQPVLVSSSICWLWATATLFVWDNSNDKLIGIVALGDPVFDLKVRDELIDWTSKDRAKRLVNIMDAYVSGAVPPYNLLLGGKLVASLIRTKEVRDDFAKDAGTPRA